MKAFLKALFDGDGVQCETYVAYSSTSITLIEDLSVMLDFLDYPYYISEYKYDPSIITEKKNKRDYYVLNIYCKYYNKYINEIGFISERRKNVVLEYLEKYSKRPTQERNVFLREQVLEEIHEGLCLTKLEKEDKKIKSETVKSKLGKNTVLLVKPNTFMNKSGDAIRSLVKNKKTAETLVVIHDDLDIPFGKIKISFNKSAGGHKGVGSIIKAIKTEGFIRMRIGISPVTASGKMKKPSGEKDVTSLILGKFKPSEMETLKKIMKNAVMGLESIVTEGREVATGEINGL